MKTHMLSDRELQLKKGEKILSNADKEVISEIEAFNEADWEREIEEIQMNEYNRSNIKSDAVMQPYLSTGFRRVVCLTVMFLITAGPIVGALYTAY